jgi:hypothetical protein
MAEFPHFRGVRVLTLAGAGLPDAAGEVPPALRDSAVAAAASSKGARFDDLTRSARGTPNDGSIGSAVAAPVRDEGAVVGVVVVFADRVNAFDGSDLRFVAGLAARLAPLFRNERVLPTL